MKNLKLVLFDLDNTLAFGKEAETFYRLYSQALEKALARSLNVSESAAKEVADAFRNKFNGRGELAFEALGLGSERWYEAICELDPQKYLKPIPAAKRVLETIKRKDLEIGVITDGPTPQAKKILNLIGIDFNVFKYFAGWEKGLSFPKGGSSKIFLDIIDRSGAEPQRIVMVGDSIETDILPAQKAGLRTVHIAQTKSPLTGQSPTIPSIEQLLELDIF